MGGVSEAHTQRATPHPVDALHTRPTNVPWATLRPAEATVVGVTLILAPGHTIYGHGAAGAGPASTHTRTHTRAGQGSMTMLLHHCHIVQAA